jgi:thiol:disulfide interchange protein DsbA
MMSLRKVLSTFAATVAFAAAGAWAQAPAPFEVMNPPQTPEGGGKIEVIEFFWYGCPHCYAVEPALNTWLKSLPPDVVFKRVPAYPSEQWGEMAKMYYTIEAMGLLDKYHSRIFDAMHKDDLNLANKRIREEWLAKNGIDVAKYNEMEKSFTVATRIARARTMTQNYRIDGVPRLVVNGKYYTTPDPAAGHDKLFSVVDQLIARVRKESTASTPAAAPKKS